MVDVEMHDGIAVVRMNRPPANAINLEMMRAVPDALTEAAAGDAGAVVLTGIPGCFSAGVDLKEIPTYGPDRQREMVTAINKAILAGYACPKPLVAAVTGHAIAGGLCLALACDFRVMARGGWRLGLTEGKAAVPFPVAALGVCKAELSATAARRLILGSILIGPDEAADLDIVDVLVAPDEVLPTALVRARELAEIPAETFARTKRSLRKAALAEMTDAIENESDPLLDAWLSDDTAGAARRVLQGSRDG